MQVRIIEARSPGSRAGGTSLAGVTVQPEPAAADDKRDDDRPDNRYENVVPVHHATLPRDVRPTACSPTPIIIQRRSAEVNWPLTIGATIPATIKAAATLLIRVAVNCTLALWTASVGTMISCSERQQSLAVTTISRTTPYRRGVALANRSARAHADPPHCSRSKAVLIPTVPENDSPAVPPRHADEGRQMDSHLKRNSCEKNACAGVLKPRHLRGVLL